jgi:pantothenate kinase
MIMGKCIKIIDSEIDYTVRYSNKTIKKSFNAITAELLKLFHENTKGRTLVAIAGPPGSGKSSVAAVLRKMLAEQGIDAVNLPIDGFHFTNDMLKTMSAGGLPGLKNRLNNGATLYQRKGAKETYDTSNLLDCMRKLKDDREFYWPVYSRKTHDPVPNGIFISGRGGLFIVEGNYLFLNTAPWTGLNPFFISTRKSLVKKRIIKRKQKGGYSGREARKHFRRSDSFNFDVVMGSSTGFDRLLVQKGKYKYVLKKSI